MNLNMISFGLLIGAFLLAFFRMIRSPSETIASWHWTVL
jgi:hypothetical protein